MVSRPNRLAEEGEPCFRAPRSRAFLGSPVVDVKIAALQRSLSAELVVCWNAGSHGMSERSIGSWRRRFSERRAFQQTQVGLRDGVRAMDKVFSQIFDGELGPA
jgi:hypothetical protein